MIGGWCKDLGNERGWRMVIIIIALLCLVYLLYAIGSTIVIRMFGIGILKKVPKQQGVLLTFDDGPHPVHTPLLLDLLKENDVKAIFFVVGELAKEYPEIIRRMHMEGHSVGIHHYRHVSSMFMTPRQLKRQLSMTEEVITSITKQAVDFYRPPWGHFNLASLFLTKKYQTIMWSHIYKDWLVEKHALDLLQKEPPKNGAIILLHDNGDTPGADEKAPEVMLSYLSKYISNNKRQNSEFINPVKLKERNR